VRGFSSGGDIADTGLSYEIGRGHLNGLKIGELGALCACDNGIGFRSAASSNSMHQFSKGAFSLCMLCVLPHASGAGVAHRHKRARLYYIHIRVCICGVCAQNNRSPLFAVMGKCIFKETRQYFQSAGCVHVSNRRSAAPETQRSRSYLSCSLPVSRTQSTRF
jgi:hypothetical protein